MLHYSLFCLYIVQFHMATSDILKVEIKISYIYLRQITLNRLHSTVGRMRG